MHRIAVISDVHANADSLAVVFEELSRESVDLSIFLGDLLTYGMQPEQVLEMLVEYNSHNESVFIKGNHDQIYFDIQGSQGVTDYKMPQFVEESVRWTLNRVYNESLAKMFDWKDDYKYGDIYFSHANPFGYGDWRYLENEEDIETAFMALEREGSCLGVFGHSHRQVVYSKFNGKCSRQDTEVNFLNKKGTIDIVNAGSIGQPRGKGFCYMTLDVDDAHVRGELHKFDCDISKNMALISASKFTKETKHRLISYLRS